MSQIHLIKDFDLSNPIELDRDMQVSALFKGDFRHILEVQLQNNAVLPRHKADVPITVFCLSGEGFFRAGDELQDLQKLGPGTFVTLEAGVDHEVVAEPAVHIIVTKFLHS